MWLSGVGVFAIFATLQWNDPDGWLWAGYYLALAFYCAIKFKGVCKPFLRPFAIGLFLVSAVTMIGLGLEGINAERLNEIGGLSVAMIWLVQGMRLGYLKARPSKINKLPEKAPS